MRRDAGICDPRIVAGVPVERTAGMTMDEFRHMEYMTATLHHYKARVLGHFVTYVFPYFFELIATVKGESVRTFCDLHYAIMD